MPLGFWHCSNWPTENPMKWVTWNGEFRWIYTHFVRSGVIVSKRETFLKTVKVLQHFCLCISLEDLNHVAFIVSLNSPPEHLSEILSQVDLRSEVWVFWCLRSFGKKRLATWTKKHPQGFDCQTELLVPHLGMFHALTRNHVEADEHCFNSALLISRQRHCCQFILVHR